MPRAGPAGTEPSGLREYALLLWRKRVTVLVVAAICVGATLAYCVLIKPTYEAIGIGAHGAAHLPDARGGQLPLRHRTDPQRARRD